MLADSAFIKVYYLAMFTNLVIRFFWVFYIPQKGSHIRLRSFFFASAEMLRRWQWNFCKSRVWSCERTDR
jgi:hypothetical protein